MMHKTKADVIIVGAGIVGSTLALAIARHAPSVHIVLLEANAQPPSWQKEVFDARVVALSEASISLLQSLAVWPDITAQRACPYVGMEVWDGEGNGLVRFDCAEIHREQLGYIVENSAALTALRRAVSQLSNIQLFAPVTLDSWQQSEQGNRLHTADGREIEAPLLIGADGAHSQLREWAGLRTREWDYDHHAIITTVTTERAHDYVARQRFSHDGPLAFLPLSHNRQAPAFHSSIVWSLKPDIAEQMMALDDQTFCAQLGRTFEHRLGHVTSTDQRYCVPLRQRHATEYGHAGFALVGDAAHTIHPLAGQGVNLGLYDTNVLAAEIVRAYKRAVPLQHPSLVKRYQRQRKVHNLLAMSSMEGFKRLFGTHNPFTLLARNRGMNLVDQSPWLKRQLMQIAAGVRR